MEAKWIVICSTVFVLTFGVPVLLAKTCFLSHGRYVRKARGLTILLVALPVAALTVLDNSSGYPPLALDVLNEIFLFSIVSIAVFPWWIKRQRQKSDQAHQAQSCLT